MAHTIRKAFAGLALAGALGASQLDAQQCQTTPRGVITIEQQAKNGNPIAGRQLQPIDHDGKPGYEASQTIDALTDRIQVFNHFEGRMVALDKESGKYFIKKDGLYFIDAAKMRADKNLKTATINLLATSYNGWDQEINGVLQDRKCTELPLKLTFPIYRGKATPSATELYKTETKARAAGDSIGNTRLDSLRSAIVTGQQDQKAMNTALSNGYDALGYRMTRVEYVQDSLAKAQKATPVYTPKETASPVRENVIAAPKTKYIAPTTEGRRGYFIVGLTGGTENSTMSLDATSAALGGVPGTQDGTFGGGYALGMIPISHGEIVVDGLVAKTQGSIKVSNPRTGGLNSDMKGTNADVSAMLTYRPLGKAVGIAAKAGYETASTDNSDFGTQSQTRPSLGIGLNAGSDVFNVSGLLLYSGSGSNSGAQKDPTGYGLEAMLNGHSKDIPVLIRLHGSKVSSDGYSRTSLGADADFSFGTSPVSGHLGYRHDSDAQGLHTDRTRLSAGLGYTFK